MSTTTSKSTDTNKKNDQSGPSELDKQAQQSQPGVLEEDDEFEEFPSQEWDDSETNLAHLNGDDVSGAGNNLWEDNWDDDDIEDEFSVQLRNELAKMGKNPAGASSGSAGAGAGVSTGGDAMQH